MTDNVTVVRYNDKLKQTDEKIQELMERYQRINVTDTSTWSNQPASFVRQLWNMLELSRVITQGLTIEMKAGELLQTGFPGPE